MTQLHFWKQLCVCVFCDRPDEAREGPAHTKKGYNRRRHWTRLCSYVTYSRSRLWFPFSCKLFVENYFTQNHLKNGLNEVGKVKCPTDPRSHVIQKVCPRSCAEGSLPDRFSLSQVLHNLLGAKVKGFLLFDELLLQVWRCPVKGFMFVRLIEKFDWWSCCVDIIVQL